MSDTVLRELQSAIVSSGGLDRGYEYRAGGRPMSVQFTGPAALNQLQGSHDKLNWFILTDEAGAAISAIDNGLRQVRERPKWVRHVVDNDPGSPQTFSAIIAVEKESR